MSNPIGFVLPGIALGSGALVARVPRGIIPRDANGNALIPIIAQVTVEEIQEDELEITEHPVEQGAVIADHAYKRPARVLLRMAWSNSPSPPGSLISQAVGVAASLFGAAVRTVIGAVTTINAVQSILTGNSPNQVFNIYQQLLALQVTRNPFSLKTGKRNYDSMLFKSLRIDTNFSTENSLVVIAACQEVIIATTQVVTLVAANQANPANTAPPQQTGNQQPQAATTFTPNNDTLPGALVGAQTQINQVSAVLSGELDFLNSSSGALSQLPGALTNVSGSLATVLSEIPPTLDIPLIPNPQTLSCPLGAPDFSSDFKTTIATLPAQITEAQGVVVGVLKQLPTLMTPPPSSLSGLSAALQSLQAQMQTTLRQLQAAPALQ